MYWTPHHRAKSQAIGVLPTTPGWPAKVITTTNTPQNINGTSKDRKNTLQFKVGRPDMPLKPYFPYMKKSLYRLFLLRQFKRRVFKGAGELLADRREIHRAGNFHLVAQLGYIPI
jgi:hypothetical protein